MTHLATSIQGVDTANKQFSAPLMTKNPVGEANHDYHTFSQKTPSRIEAIDGDKCDGIEPYYDPRYCERS
jgi:hypothetical protein